MSSLGILTIAGFLSAMVILTFFMYGKIKIK